VATTGSALEHGCVDGVEASVSAATGPGGKAKVSQTLGSGAFLNQETAEIGNLGFCNGSEWPEAEPTAFAQSKLSISRPFPDIKKGPSPKACSSWDGYYGINKNGFRPEPPKPQHRENIDIYSYEFCHDNNTEIRTPTRMIGMKIIKRIKIHIQIIRKKTMLHTLIK